MIRPDAQGERDGCEALLVDYGGVLTTSMTAAFAAFCVATGVNPERMKDLLAMAYAGGDGEPTDAGIMQDTVRAVETGQIDPEEFDRQLAAALSVGLPEPLEPAGLTGRLLERLGPDREMRAAVAEARRQGVPAGLISNTWGLRPNPDIDAMFDAVVLSGREGIRKPDPEIYLLAASRLGVDPERCVFVDDVPVNVDGARAVGMAGVLHRAAAITIPKLEVVLGISLGGR